MTEYTITTTHVMIDTPETDDIKKKTINDLLAQFPIINKFYLTLMGIGGIAFMSESCEIQMLVFITTCAGNEFNLNQTASASIASIVFAGQLVGALAWGRICDVYGRRNSFILACFIISLFGYLSGLAPSFSWLLIFRFIVGFGTGSLPIPFDLLSEFLPPTTSYKLFNSSKNKVLCIVSGIFWTLGTISIAGIAWGLLNFIKWRGLAFIAATPCGLVCVIAYFLLPESPRWLLANKQVKDAENVLKYAFSTAGHSPTYLLTHSLTHSLTYSGIVCEPFLLDEKQEDFNDDYADKNSLSNINKYISGKRNAILLTFTSLIWLLFGFSLYGSILLSGKLYTFQPNNNLRCDFNYQAIFITMSGQMVGFIMALLLIDVVGLYLTQCILFSIAGITLFIIGELSVHNGLNNSYVTILTLLSVGCVFGGSQGTWLTSPSIFPTSLRATGHTFLFAIGRIGAFSSSYVAYNNIFEIKIMSMIFGSSLMLAAIINLFLYKYNLECEKMNIYEKLHVQKATKSLLHVG